MARSTGDAIEWGRSWVDSTRRAPTKDGTWLAWCLVFVRSCFGIDAAYTSAIKAWAGAERRHVTSRAESIPAGVPVFWRTPGPHGHVALSLGNGYVLSNDILRRGKIDVVHSDVITKRWGATLLGWTEDLNGRTVWSPPKPTPPAVRVKPTFRRLHDKELDLIEKLQHLQPGTPQHARRERELAEVYKYLRTYPASQYAARRRECYAAKDQAYRARPKKPKTVERYERLITRIDFLVRRGIPA
ncbi:hypothetical protein [Nocardioides zeae]|uniref:CHAP domain-containing protein n=1 Tax=Nocardioides zeae TaxID=1457234 RepID=A0AAJ1U1S7_9ACTN|nr:hypothetical protein [Nocardioides zeae]MDQ1103893.1 hypothetical protein [Nocardioides zeae]